MIGTSYCASKSVILLVDDTTDDLMLLEKLLKEQYEIKIATNGELAVQISQSDSPPDLILLDGVN